MEITITARHTTVGDRVRQHIEEKLEKVTQLAPRARRVEVQIDHENNPRQAATAERIEITVHDTGPVIRAEASAADLYGALDIAQDKLMERLRRTRDRRKPHHVHNRSAKRNGTADPLPDDLLESLHTPPQNSSDDDEYSPIAIREKVHEAAPMSLDDALYQMELVGHDFYLFVDEATHQPSVVYRRRGWSYGVIRLEPQLETAEKSATSHTPAGAS